MLGESYKDAIASVEALETIEKAGERVSTLAVELKADLERRVEWTRDREEDAEEIERVGTDAERGSRVKFLLDTPEKMWGLLEDSDYENAAVRLMAAQEMLGEMTSGRGDAEALYASFPVARQQAMVLNSFNVHVSKRARAGLERPTLRATDVASALKSLIVVEKLSRKRALLLLLQTRQARVRACLRDIATATVTHDGLKKRLTAVMVDVKSTLKVCFEVFAGPQPLLDSSSTQSLTARDLFEGVFEPQVEWERFQAAFTERTSRKNENVNEGTIMDACLEWMDRLATDVSQRGVAVFGRISNCDELSSLEADFSSEDKEWDATCKALFNRRVDLWSILFERPWLQQGFSLFKKSLTFAHLKPQIDTAIVDARKKSRSDSRKESSMWSSSSSSTDEITNVPDDVKCARAVARAINNIMLSVRKEALMLQGVQLGGNVELEGRIAQLEQHIHSCAHKGLVELAKSLSAKVESHPNDVPCALMVGHLARAVMDIVKEVTVLLKPANSWPKYNESAELIIKPIRTLRGMKQPKEPQNVKIDEVKAEFERAMNAGYSVWVKKCSTDTVREFKEALSADHSLASDSAPPHWEEVADKTGDGLQLQLPATPSSYVLTSIHGVLQEVQQIGGHLLPVSAIRMLASSLVDGVLQAYADSLSRGRRSEKGTLQMLMDTKFAADVLSLKDASRLSALQKQLTGTLDPIDWATYEPYLWENEKRAYRRCSVLLGGFVQLADLYQDTSIKPAGTKASASAVKKAMPRFTYLPVSLPTLRGLNAESRKTKIDWGEIEAQTFEDEEREGLFSSFKNILREFA